MLDGAAPGPVELVVPSFPVEHDHGLVLMDTGLAPEAARDPVHDPEDRARFGAPGEVSGTRP